MSLKNTRYALMLVLCFALCLLIGKADTQAAQKKATKASKFGYINSENKLVLKFEDFSRTGYSYKFSNGKKTYHGKRKFKTGRNEVVIPLGKYYAPKTRYRLTLTDLSDPTDSLSMYYYTGTKVKNLNVKGLNYKIKADWKAIHSNYSEYILGVCSSPASTKAAAYRNNISGKAKSAVVAAARLKSGTYRVYIRSVKQFGNKSYYGYGMVDSYRHAAKPAKVLGLTGTVGANTAAISWSPVKGATGYVVYCKKSGKHRFRTIKTGYQGTSLTINGLKGGKTSVFRVRAYTKVGTSVSYGRYSSNLKLKIPDVAGRVRHVRFNLNSKYKLILDWDRTPKATSYRVYYKLATSSKYRKYKTTKKTEVLLNKLKENTKYNMMVVAFTRSGGRWFKSSKPAVVKTIIPKAYVSRNYNRMLASRVRTIKYTSRGSQFTRKKYPKAIKEAYVNFKGYKSKTRYLIWVSHFTQQATIFKGSKGHWKQVRAFTIGSGTHYHHSPRGVFRIKYKEKGWFYSSTKILYVTHYYGNTSFHSRPLWYNGSVATSTIGRPVSHGCVRCYTSDARYIYNNMPRGTTVVSW